MREFAKASQGMATLRNLVRFVPGVSECHVFGALPHSQTWHWLRGSNSTWRTKRHPRRLGMFFVDDAWVTTLHPA